MAGAVEAVFKDAPAAGAPSTNTLTTVVPFGFTVEGTSTFNCFVAA